MRTGPACRDFVEEGAVDQVDDLQVTRQQSLEERDRPDFECLGQQRVVRVREHAARDFPRGLDGNLVLVDQQPDEFGNGQRRVRVVQLDRDRVGQRVEATTFGEVLRQHVLQAGADEEVLLLETQFLALRRGVVGVKNARDVLGLCLRRRRLDVPARIELLDVERRDRPAGPQPQVVDRGAAVARDQLVETHGPDVLRLDPAVARAARGVLGADAPAAKAHDVPRVVARDFPRTALTHPRARDFALPAVLVDDLRENAVVVANAVADGRKLQRGKRIEETRGEAPEAAVAEAGIDFFLRDAIEVVTELGEHFTRFLHQVAFQARESIDE
jgi:hypothetical protein